MEPMFEKITPEPEDIKKTVRTLESRAGNAKTAQGLA
ncbi:hypothetical protein ILFOPFJJ_06460 [Ensifer psoraleae]|nr:hypothetical protein [Sinorhizobium psoraleae]